MYKKNLKNQTTEGKMKSNILQLNWTFLDAMKYFYVLQKIEVFIPP